MKSRTHIYMAELILKEIDNGTLTLPGLGTYTIPNDVVSALKNNPSAFRAGAVGPDFYPDMLVGQSVIHPEKSGEYLTYMFEQYGAMPPNHPDKQKSYAFLLGFMMHYSGDLYGHYYVNQWARGWFELDLNVEKMKKIARHILVESYMDGKVPLNMETLLEAPINFVKDCFMSLEMKENYKKASIKMPMDVFRELENAISDCANNSTTNMLDLACYFPGWQSDIDTGVIHWLRSWQSVAFILSDKNHKMREAKEVLDNWASSHLALMLGIPHWAKDLTASIQRVIEALNILKPLKDAIKQALFEYMKAFVMAVAGETVKTIEEAIEKIEAFFKDPATYLNNGILYKEKDITKKLDEEMNNFGTNDKTTEQSFHAFYQCLNMCKLCLLGPENLNKLIEKQSPSIKGFYKRPAYPAGVRNLKISIKTQKNVPLWKSGCSTCGTDDNVYFALQMKDGSSYEKLLETPGHNDFESNNVDNFVFNLPKTIPLDKIEKLQLRKDYIRISDDWKPKWIKLFDDAGNEFFHSDIHFMLEGRKKYEIPAAIGTSQNQVSIDPAIISFLYSLDGAGEKDNGANPTKELPWDRKGFPFYADPQLRKTVYQELFVKEASV